MDATAAVRVEGTLFKRNAGFLRPWRSRPAHVTDDGFLRYSKKKGGGHKTKEIDLVKSILSQQVVQAHGHFCFEVQSGAKSFALGFADRSEAQTWLEVLREVADENAAGRRAWAANLRRVLTLSLRERKALVKDMSDRDWVNEWMFCLRSLRNKEKNVASRRRRLKRLYTIWLQFQLFAEVVAEVYFARVQDRELSSASLGPKSSDQSSEIDFDQRSVDSSTSSSNGKSSVASVSPRSTSLASRPPDDVDEQRFKTLRLQFSTRSWRGRKRLEREVEHFARFRAVIDFVMAEKIVDGSLIEKLPSFPLVAAFSVRGVRVVATAEPLRDRSAVVPMDKRDLMELVQALKLTKMLRAFPYGELPNIALRKIPGNAEKTIAGVSTRFDDVLLHSLRSPMVHGVLIRASSGDSSDLELLTAHDMNELVQDKEAHWVPYLDVVYYQLASNAAPGVENWRAKAFLLKGPHSVVTGDVVVSVDADKCRLPLDLKEGLVAKQQLEIHPLVRRLEDVKTSTARLIPSAGSGSTTPQKIDASYAFAKTTEQSLKNLVVLSVKEFAGQLVTFGDSPTESTSHTALQQQQAPPASSSRSFLTRSNTDPANFGRSEHAPSVSGPESGLRRRSSFAATGAAESSSSPASSIYVIDGVHLREVMRESGVNMRFLPLVFEYLDSTRQPGTRILVASELVARLAKTLFRFRLFSDENVTTSHWQTRKHRLIRFIDSIMHGVFHDDLPTPCDIDECVGDQFWNVDAPILLMLGPHASSAALDYACVYSGSAIAVYRHAIRGNPSVLFTALLHAFGAQMADGVLPSLDDNRFVSVQFLRNESDLVFGNEAEDPKLAMQLQPTLLWSHVQFFRLQFNDLKRAPKSADPVNGGDATRAMQTFDSFAGATSYRSYFATISEHVRNTLQHPHELRVEKESKVWEDTHAVRSRLVKALRAASADDDSGGVAKEYCDNARDIIFGGHTRFPVEFLIALRCLEIVSGDEDEILSRSDEWREILSMLRFFYRPANQSQFAKSSSSHPLFSVVYFMIHLAGAPARKPLRSELETSQLQQSWLSVIATVDAHCRRAAQKSWAADPVNAIATKAASFEFERRQSLHKLSSTSSISSSMSDDRSDSASSQGELKHVNTARAMNLEAKLTAAAVRQDVLWFVESFLVPAVRSGSWTMPGARFLTLSRSGVFTRQRSEDTGATPAPGVALVWGEQFGLSLDEEAQIAAAPSGSRLASLRARPAESPAKVELLRFPSALRRVVQVSCGYRHTALVTDNRQLYTYGYGECGRLGHGDEASVPTPTAVGFFESLIESVGAHVGGIAQVSCGREHTMAVLVNGELYGFGWAEAGRLGTGDTGCCLFPTKVLSLQNIQAAACGREHTLVLTKHGEVFACGAGFGGRLGIGSEADEELPVLVTALAGERVVKVDAGECHSAALTDSGDVFTWGFGSSGALGSGTRENSLLPRQVSGGWADDRDEQGAPAKVTALACGGYHTLVGTSAGKLYGWGDAAAGQLGSDLVAVPDMVVLVPAELPLLPARAKLSWAAAPAIRELACGTFTSAACLDDGRLFLWGSPLAGNSAPLHADDAKVARVEALEDFAVHRVSCGAYHVVALTRGLEFA